MTIEVLVACHPLNCTTLEEYKQYKSSDTEQWTTFHCVDYAINAEERSSTCTGPPSRDACDIAEVPYVRGVVLRDVLRVDKYCSWAVCGHRESSSSTLLVLKSERQSKRV